MIRITKGGKGVNIRRLAETIERDVIKTALVELERKVRGAASSIVDPETGRHAEVVVDRLPGDRIAVRTDGSTALARILEQRLGLDAGTVATMTLNAPTPPRVYLAHASEDKAAVAPLAEALLAKGIAVWFDAWDVRVGEGLRREMEKGLSAMTHFVAFLTPVALTKPWIAAEIDVAMIRRVAGESRLVPLLVGIEPEDLPPFLRSLHGLRFDPSEAADIAKLVDHLHGVSLKPEPGLAPTYVRNRPKELSGWSPAAVEIGRHLVTSSVHALFHDPIVTLDQLVAGTGLNEEDVRVAILDLCEGGYLWRSAGRDHFAPEAAMFSDFDEAFMPHSPRADAVAVATLMLKGPTDTVPVETLARDLGWEARRMNSAICHLGRTRAVRERNALESAPWRAIVLVRIDETLRFVRNRS